MDKATLTANEKAPKESISRDSLRPTMEADE